ncbi:hypothetical protein MYXO_02663 [Myxococcaceae bacterium]|nr:hypothetical protein MYXO_02663 [Myxococcaceae bacterium]
MASTRGNRRRTAPGSPLPAPEPEIDPAGAGVPEILRRAITAGLSGILSTNEAVRRAVGEAMPREWVDFAVDQSERTRSEFIERLAGELARTLESLDMVEMAERFFEGRTIEVKAQIQLLPREGRMRTRGVSVGVARPDRKR